MMHAYDKKYLDDAMKNLGEAFDYAINDCRMLPDEFMDMFLTGGIAEQFGNGIPKYVAGMSGTELVWEVLERSGLERELPEAGIVYDVTAEYWCGWVLAYYQWHSGRSFKNIRQQISIGEILKLYPTLHEATEDKFVDTVNRMIQRNDSVTKLQTLRRLTGYSQKMLALKSGVSLRMIQQYEQQAKDINKAAGIHLISLARTLGCRVEDLLEANEKTEKGTTEE